MWQQACAEPNKLPDRALFLAQQMSGVPGVMAPGHPGMAISEPVPGAKPLPVPPELAALRAGGGSMGQQVCSPELESTSMLSNEDVQCCSHVQGCHHLRVWAQHPGSTSHFSEVSLQ